MALSNPNLIIDFPPRCDWFKRPDITLIATNRRSIDESYGGGDAIVTMKEELHRRQRVRFALASTLVVYDASQYKDNDGDAMSSSLWYTQGDEDLFKKSARRDIERILRAEKYPKNEGSRRTDNSDSEDLCPVGLEQSLISRDHSRRRVIARGLVRDAVFWEQRASPGAGLQESSSSPSSRRWGPCRRDHAEAIAEASRQASEWSRAQAQAIGYFQAHVVNIDDSLTILSMS